MKVSAIVPVWNGRAHLERLLASLKTQTTPPSEVIVVDNGSTDGAREVAEQFGARVIHFVENRGFAAAVNRGVSESRCELLAILNSDVQLETEWTSLLASALGQSQRWFATGLILSAKSPGMIDGAWDLVSKAGMPWRSGSGFPAATAAFSRDRPIDIASFTAILLRRDLWVRMGPLDERFESYLEDVDFGLRCLKSGYGGWYTAAARCSHWGGATLGPWNADSVRRASRNQVFLIRKHWSPALRRRWAWNLLVGQCLWGLLAMKHGAGLAWILGKREGLARTHEFDSTLSVDPPAIEAQAREIQSLQSRYGFDRYWRWYGRLTGRRHPEAE